MKNTIFTLSMLLLLSGTAAAGPFGEVYAYPNPAVSAVQVTFHAQVENASGAEFSVYTTAGELIHQGQVAGDPSIINGKSAYEYKYQFAGLASGAYFLVVRAHQASGDVIARKFFIVAN